MKILNEDELQIAEEVLFKQQPKSFKVDVTVLKILSSSCQHLNKFGFVFVGIWLCICYKQEQTNYFGRGC